MNKFIPISQPSITSKEIEYVTKAVSSGWVSSLGRYIDEFEEKFAKFCGTKYGIAVSNGTVGLHLLLAAYGIGPGDEVIIPDLTFIATANAVRYTGAEVVCADIDKDTLCINPESIASLITPRTKAIIPVDLYGHPADMDKINQIAQKHNLFVLEDAAEAHGAEYKNRKTGSLTDNGIFSFYGNKIITSGEGGMITTNNTEIFEKARMLRDHAMSKEKRYWHEQIGYNYRITNLQAALAVAQLERIEELLTKREHIYNMYKSILSKNTQLRLNRENKDIKNVCWLMCAEIEHFDAEKRDKLIQTLKSKNIDSRPYFYPVSAMPMFKKMNNPVSYHISSIGINLPTYYDLSDDEIEYICTTLLNLI